MGGSCGLLGAGKLKNASFLTQLFAIVGHACADVDACGLEYMGVVSTALPETA